MTTLSTSPYFLRALYEWCVDSGLTPYISVRVDEQTKVPRAFVKDGQIVLNVGPNAVRELRMDNEWVSFNARFGGVAQDVFVPVGNVLAIYARETGEGMAFQQAQSPLAEAGPPVEAQDPTPPPEQPPRPSGRPNLRVVK